MGAHPRLRPVPAGFPGCQTVIALVDNNSPGPVPAWVAETPEVIFHRNNWNAGLTAANNQAYEMLQSSGAEYVLILNNDTEVEADALAILAAFLETNQGAGIAAPAITYASRHDVVWSAGGRYCRWRMKQRQFYRYVSDLPQEPVRCFRSQDVP